MATVSVTDESFENDVLKYRAKANPGGGVVFAHTGRSDVQIVGPHLSSS